MKLFIPKRNHFLVGVVINHILRKVICKSMKRNVRRKYKCFILYLESMNLL